MGWEHLCSAIPSEWMSLDTETLTGSNTQKQTSRHESTQPQGQTRKQGSTQTQLPLGKEDVSRAAREWHWARAVNPELCQAVPGLCFHRWSKGQEREGGWETASKENAQNYRGQGHHTEQWDHRDGTREPRTVLGHGYLGGGRHWDTEQGLSVWLVVLFIQWRHMALPDS